MIFHQILWQLINDETVYREWMMQEKKLGNEEDECVSDTT